jgi:hypothetical protein
MISSKCQIAPYGMLKLFMSWPFCVVLIKPWRWSYLVDLMGSEECISGITSVDPSQLNDEPYIGCAHNLRTTAILAAV